jgi:PKD repeat protein
MNPANPTTTAGRLRRAPKWIPLAAITLACWSDSTTGPQSIRPSGLRIGNPDETVFLIGAGDIAGCNSSWRDEATAALIAQHPDALVITVGDNAYPDGTAANFGCYHASWGPFKSRTYPIPGNHEYHTPDAVPYFDYFNGVGVDSGRAGSRGRGYYVFDYGAWRIYALNSEIDASATSAQVAWLRADLAANPRQCSLAYLHRSLFTSSSKHGPDSKAKPLWDALYEARVEAVISAHNHQYERFARQRPDGTRDDANGARAFVVGSGGAGLYGFGTPRTNSEKRIAGFGVLDLTLRPGGYSWRFIPIAGSTAEDSGSEECSGGRPPSTSISLSVTGQEDATKQYMTLDWTGARGTTVDVYRNGVFLANTPNDGHYTNSRTTQPGVTYTYHICEAATTVCSNQATITFGGGTPPANVPPTASFASSCTGLTCSFTDLSTDSDGGVTAWGWAFGDGEGSTARNPSRVYATSGTYTVTLTATDDDAATGTASKSITVSGGVSTITLSVTGRQDATKHYMTLVWSGANGATVDVYRNGAFLANTANDGHYTNSRTIRVPVTYTYKVCEAGTAICSNEATVGFP